MKYQRYLSYALIAAVLLTGCSGSGNSVQSSGQTLSDHFQRESSQAADYTKTDSQYSSEKDYVLTVWEDYLNVLNQMYTSSKWVYPYIDAYIETNEWQDLSEARTACLLAAEYINNLEMDEPAISSEDYASLTDQSIDLSFIPVELDSLSESVSFQYTLFRYDYFYDLEENYDLKLVHKHIGKKLSFYEEYEQVWCDYYLYMTNYLFLELYDSEDVQDYMDKLAINYPVIFQDYETPFSDKDDAENAANVCYDRVEEMISVHSQNNAEYELEYDEYLDALKAGNSEEIAEMLIKPENAPRLMPYPEYFSSDDAEYMPYIMTDAGMKKSLQYSDSLENAEISEQVRIADFDQEDLDEYIEYLTKLGFEIQNTDTSNYKLITEDYNLLMSVDQENVLTLDFEQSDVTFTDQMDWIKN